GLAAGVLDTAQRGAPEAHLDLAHPHRLVPEALGELALGEHGCLARAQGLPVGVVGTVVEAPRNARLRVLPGGGGDQAPHLELDELPEGVEAGDAAGVDDEGAPTQAGHALIPPGS